MYKLGVVFIAEDVKLDREFCGSLDLDDHPFLRTTFFVHLLFLENLKSFYTAIND